MQGEVFQTPFAALDRLQNRAQPGLFAIATEQTKRPVEMLAPGDGSLHALVEIQLFDVGRNDLFDIAPDQLMAAVQHLLLEVAVDRFDPPLGVELQYQHLAVQAALDLLHGQQLFAQTEVFLFQFAVEHQRSPGAESIIRMLLHRLIVRHS
ncbi:hypothetical protein D3C77_342270 [compost metagenome]